ncbi:MAG: Gfo/Idh/MocA family oxidoreductase [Acidobacteria bacterium]|nr:Gfo/Idh/MocA family oxidoreductase [Acidobacteriota bacterium]
MRRREMLYAAGGGLLSPASLAAMQVGRAAPSSSKKIRLGIVGGGFGTQFSFHEHPNCTVTAVTDLRADRRARMQQVFRCDTAYPSYEEMLKQEKRLDAVAIFSGALDHVKHVEAAMNRGLHVYCAVPTCQTLDEAARLKSVVERTGLKYMLGETSYYRPGCIHARHLHDSGALGEIFYSEINYYHDRGDLGELVENKKTRFYEPDGSRSWRWGLAPMQYPTHCLGFVVGVTRERIRSVSALGWGSQHPYLTENRYKNPYWNESALMETDKGHMVRCNVFWLVGEDGERANWYGSNGTLYMANTGRHGDLFQKRLSKAEAVKYPDYLQDKMIPPSMRHASGHGGSHVFLSAEFINALVEDRKPVIDVYDALAMMVPGIIAHQSALKGGERMKVPSFDKA